MSNYLLSRDFLVGCDDNRVMPQRGKSDFNTAFCRRTKEARGLASFTQESIAELFGMDRDTYKQYEIRSPLPHYLIPRFCIATHVTPAWLFGFKAAKQATPLPFPSAHQASKS